MAQGSDFAIQIILDVAERTYETEKAMIRAEKAAAEASFLHEANLIAVQEICRLASPDDQAEQKRGVVRVLKELFGAHH